MKLILALTILSVVLIVMCLTELVPDGPILYIAGLMVGCFGLTTALYLEPENESTK